MVSIDARSDNSLGDIFLYITILYYLHDFFIKTRDRIIGVASYSSTSSSSSP